MWRVLFVLLLWSAPAWAQLPFEPSGLMNGGSCLNATVSSGLAGRWLACANASVSGTVAFDLSGNGNNGTLVNSPAVVTAQVGKGLRFDGTPGQAVNLPSSAALNIKTFTYCAGISLNVTNITQYIIAWDASALPSFNINATTRTLQLSSQGIIGIAVSSSAFPASGFGHACVSYDASGNYAFYINGTPAGSGNNLVTFGAFGARHMIFGGIAGSQAQYVSNDVRVYNRVLSAGEISNISLKFSYGLAFNDNLRIPPQLIVVARGDDLAADNDNYPLLDKLLPAEWSAGLLALK